MTELILVAASGLAREALEAVRTQDRYDVVGFVDDNPERWGDVLNDVKVLGGLEVVSEHPTAQLLVCAGKGASRQAIVERLGFDDARYATVVHVDARIPASCSVGVGSIVLAGTVLTADVVVGRHVVTMPNVTLTHDDVVEDFATVCANVTLGGSVRVGQRSYLGMSSAVRECVTVGADAVVGMGSVILRSVPDGETWVGNPGRRLVTRTGADD